MSTYISAIQEEFEGAPQLMESCVDPGTDSVGVGEEEGGVVVRGLHATTMYEQPFHLMLQAAGNKGPDPFTLSAGRSKNAVVVGA